MVFCAGARCVAALPEQLFEQICNEATQTPNAHEMENAAEDAKKINNNK